MAQKRIVVLISGSGSNLQAIIDATQAPNFGAKVVAVISNCPGVKGLQRAERHGIDARLLNHKDFASRDAFDAKLQAIIDGYQPDLLVLAGFMRILTDEFVQHYEGRMLNIHPSLLPKYPGLHTHRRALEAKDAYHGATVHFVTAELDGGPAIIQARIPILPDDTEQSLAGRLLEKEHEIYPQAVQWAVSGRVVLQDGQAWLDGTPLPAGGQAY